MSKKKVNKVVKKSELVDSKPIVETSPEVKTVKKETKVVEPVVSKEIKVIEPTIFDRHRKHIETARDGYLKDLTYPEAMEILRYIQKETGHKLGLNMSCASCLIDLLKMFSRLEDK